MSDEPIHNSPAVNHDGYEHEDLGPRGIFYFMAGLVVFTIVIYAIIFGMYRFLDSYQMSRQTPMSPIVAPPADTRIVTPEETQNFPQPRLEENERTQLRRVIEGQDRKLATYDWVDKDKGVVQIPIDRAMDLVAQRGLPVRPEGATATAPAPAKKQKTKMPTTPAQDGN